MTAVKPNPTDKLATALAKQDQVPDSSLQTLISKATKELGRALPAHLSAERMTRIALTCIRLNPDLARCTPESFMGSLFVLAQLGLEPIAGRAYLLPFNNSRKIGTEWKTIKEVQALVGYRGYIELFYRHNSGLSIDAQTVCANDTFDFEYGTNAFLKHKPAENERGEPIKYYAISKLAGGATLFHVMSKAEVLAHAKEHSKTYNKEKDEFYKNTPWRDDFDAMSKKTCVLQLAKMLPLSMELQRALQVDETSRDYRDGIDSMLDSPITTTWTKPGVESAQNASNPSNSAPGEAIDTKVRHTPESGSIPEPGSFEAS